MYLDIVAEAEAEITAAGEGIRAYHGNDAASAFTERVAELLSEELARVNEEITSNTTGKLFQPVDEAASQKWSQPVYRLRVETATKRKRSSSVGLWYAYYALIDANNAGTPDTMRLFAFRHSAARPIGSGGDTGE